MRRFVRDRFFPSVPCSLRSSGAFGYIEALIDTGSPFTVLSTLDALRLNLPLTKMGKGEPVSLAGYRFINHRIGATLTFATEEQTALRLDVPDLGVLVPTQVNRKTLEDVKHIPSIIGNDFLEDQKLALYVNPSARIGYLEF